MGSSGLFGNSVSCQPCHPQVEMVVEMAQVSQYALAGGESMPRYC
jgi:hypothetical protein